MTKYRLQIFKYFNPFFYALIRCDNKKYVDGYFASFFKHFSDLTTRIYTCVTCREPHNNPVECKRPVPRTT